MKSTVRQSKEKLPLSEDNLVPKSKAKLPVSEGNLKKAALRLLSQKLVSTEVFYVQRVLGAKATQEDIDANVVAVRKLPWASITVAD